VSYLVQGEKSANSILPTCKFQGGSKEPPHRRGRSQETGNQP